MSNEEILSALQNELNKTPELGSREELVMVTTITGPKKAIVISAPAYFYRGRPGRYAGVVAIGLTTLANAVKAEAGVLIAAWPLGLYVTENNRIINSRPVPPAKWPVPFLTTPTRSEGWIEARPYAHPKFGQIVEGGVSGILSEEGCVAGWLSPAAVRAVAKTVLEAKANEFRPTLWLRPSDEAATPSASAEAGAEAASEAASEADEGVPLDKAEAATDVATDEVTD